MSTSRPQFARIPQDINVSLLQNALVVVVGVGMVGSQIAEGLARLTVGNLRLIDHDVYEWDNTLRHALPVEYNGWNKAIALEDWLPLQIEGLHVEAIPRKIDASVTDKEIDSWIADADLVVAATDDRVAQRRIGHRTLIKEVAAVFPALYPRLGGGEVILQLGPEWPCFGCWDYFRRDTEQLRGQRATDHAAQPIIFHAEQMCLGYLDSGSQQHHLLRGERAGDPPEQLIALDPAGVPSFGRLTRRPTCPSCNGGRPSIQQPATPPNITSPQEPQQPSTWSQYDAWRLTSTPQRPPARVSTATTSEGATLVSAIGLLLATAVGSLVGMFLFCLACLAGGFLAIAIPGYLILLLLGGLH